MKYAILVFCSLILSQSLQAQLLDDFEDADLSSAPQWNGMLNAFTSQGGKLKSNYATANAVFYISTPLQIDSSFQWSFDVQLQFNTSSLNYVDAFLFADSVNLSKSRQGLFVRLGGSADEVALFKVVNGIEYKIIDGADAVLNTSNNSLKIKVLSNLDTISLFRFQSSTQQWVCEGRMAHDLTSKLAQSGIRIRQSSSAFFGKHFFDNWYAGEIPRDTIAPHIDSFSYNAFSQSIHLYWNETLDSTSAVDTGTYRIAAQHLGSILLSGSSVIVNFSPPLMPNQWQTLAIKGLKDLSGNPVDTAIRFFTLKKRCRRSETCSSPN